MMLLIEIIGWLGTSLIVFAFYLNSNNKIDAKSRIYQLMNLMGSICVGINAYYFGALPSLWLQIIWAIISIFALAKIYKFIGER